MEGWKELHLLSGDQGIPTEHRILKGMLLAAQQVTLEPGYGQREALHEENQAP